MAKRTGSTPPNILIAIPTTFRDAGLFNLLDSLNQATEQSGNEVDVLIVDNTLKGDPGIARVFPRWASCRISYLHVPAPGVVQARNGAVQFFRERSHTNLVFIDDDQVVDPTWLLQLEGLLARMSGDILAGAVEFLLPEGVTDAYVIEYYNEARRRGEGSRLSETGAGNVAIPRHVFERLAWQAFDERFNQAGGEDTEFFGRATRAGCQIIWCTSMLAREAVAKDRATKRWIRRRLRLTGLARAQIGGSRPKALVGGCARVVLGGLRAVRFCVSNGRTSFYGEGMLLSGLGFVDFALGASRPSFYG